MGRQIILRAKEDRRTYRHLLMGHPYTVGLPRVNLILHDSGKPLDHHIIVPELIFKHTEID